MIYIKYEPTDLRNLLTNFFDDNYNERRGVTTYHDKECTQVQCPDRKYRSYSDIYEMVQTYFPDTPTKDITHTLITLNFGDEWFPWMTYCDDIENCTMSYYDCLHSKLWRYAEDKSWKTPKYDWVTLLSELDIHSYDDLSAYIKEHKV
jgi:hypothetical protein